MDRQILGILAGFFLLLIVFRVAEIFRQKDKRLPLMRRGFATDLAWFAFTPLVTKALTRFGLALAILPAALYIHGRFDPQLILDGYGPAARLPLPIQAVLILLVGDFFGYWMHRAFHRQRLWSFHAVHHSSRDLDWLSAVRVHPVNDLFNRIATALPLVLLGFSAIAVASIIPLLTLMAILIHANLDWDFGPFRSVIASPVFHRWHHTDELEARDKNFAGLFPVWDLLFGTYYMPRDRLPTRFGTETPVPGSFLGQLVFPFTRQRRG